ncbi:MAG: exo-beta-N-acetylmuramidase NamZ domain-containing protein [Spirosomataceae bacterium]
MQLLIHLLLVGSFFFGGKDKTDSSIDKQEIVLGAERRELYYPRLKGKNIGMVVNHTSMVGDVHLVDQLVSDGLTVKTIFAPEHGFRGNADAGEIVKDGKDVSTGLPIVSLYGKNKKPSPEQLKGLDVVIFDIQDVGLRFYTYISTMYYVMEACAEQNIQVIILDRPNPNGHYVDGPVLEKEFKSFVGIVPIPIVHGMTVGELGQLINEEGYLSNGVSCSLLVVPCEGYTHTTPYILPVKPSPNLPNQQAILLYPSICFFEGTTISVGRGTNTQFQVIGGEYKEYGNYTFTPVDMAGAQNPPLEGKVCFGRDLRNLDMYAIRFSLSFLLEMYEKSPKKETFFLSTNHFNLLAGNAWLKEMVIQGASEEEIRKRWQPELAKFKDVRKKYLIYAE